MSKELDDLRIKAAELAKELNVEMDVSKLPTKAVEGVIANFEAQKEKLVNGGEGPGEGGGSSEGDNKVLSEEEKLEAANKHLVDANGFFEKEDFDNSLIELNKAIELCPEYALAYFNRGFSLIAKEEVVDAIADYAKAIELDPDFSAAYYELGAAKEKNGANPLEIKEAFENYLKRANDGEEKFITHAKEFLTALENQNVAKAPVKEKTPKKPTPKPRFSKEELKGFVVSTGKSVTSKRGIIDAGKPATPELFNGGQKTFDRLKDNGTLVTLKEYNVSVGIK